MTTVPAVRRRNIIHPEDQRAQDEASVELTRLRLERFGAVEYARMIGITHNNLWQFEQRSRTNVGILALERRAAPLGLTLALDVKGLPAEVEDDLDVMVLAHHFKITAPTDEVVTRAKATAILTATRLQVARVLLGVTERELAARMGITQATVNGLIQDVGATSRIASFQRLARALAPDGRVVPRLAPLGGE